VGNSWSAISGAGSHMNAICGQLAIQRFFVDGPNMHAICVCVYILIRMIMIVASALYFLHMQRFAFLRSKSIQAVKVMGVADNALGDEINTSFECLFEVLIVPKTSLHLTNMTHAQ